MKPFPSLFPSYNASKRQHQKPPVSPSHNASSTPFALESKQVPAAASTAAGPQPHTMISSAKCPTHTTVVTLPATPSPSPLQTSPFLTNISTLSLNLVQNPMPLSSKYASTLTREALETSNSGPSNIFRLIAIVSAHSWQSSALSPGGDTST